jgi:hypothetical protein
MPGTWRATRNKHRSRVDLVFCPRHELATFQTGRGGQRLVGRTECQDRPEGRARAGCQPERFSTRPIRSVSSCGCLRSTYLVPPGSATTALSRRGSPSAPCTMSAISPTAADLGYVFRASQTVRHRSWSNSCMVASRSCVSYTPRAGRFQVPAATSRLRRLVSTPCSSHCAVDTRPPCPRATSRRGGGRSAPDLIAPLQPTSHRGAACPQGLLRCRAGVLFRQRGCNGSNLRLRAEPRGPNRTSGGRAHELSTRSTAASGMCIHAGRCRNS